MSLKKHTVRFVVGSLDVGGTEKHLSMVLPRLANPEFTPVVITLTHKGALAKNLEQSGINVYQPHPCIRIIYRIPLLSRLLGPFAALIYLVTMYIRTPAKLTCFYLPAAYYIGGIATLITGEGGRTVMFRRSLNNYRDGQPVITYIENFLHKKVSRIVGNSRAVIQQLVEEEGVPGKKVTLIYNGIDVTVFKNRNNRSSLRKTLGLADDEIVLCLVANLIPYKGHTDLIDALISIKAEIPRQWKLLCVGSGIEKREDLIRQVESGGLNKHVKWLGRRDDVPAILSAADIGLLVSHQEGFSNAILEGMAAGLPMIVTDVGGNSEAIEHQKSGLIVRPHDPRGLSAAILLLMNDQDLARQYGVAARERVEKYFTIETCVDNYKSFFNEVVKNEEGSALN